MAATGRHFCAEDWHAIVMALIAGGDASYGHDQAKADLDPVAVSFTLDGDSLQTSRTSIKSFQNAQRFGLDRAWYFQEGNAMAPEDLGVGQHELAARFTDPGTGLEETNGITVFIDGPGTGACLGDTTH
jgi:hypothetical protein